MPTGVPEIDESTARYVLGTDEAGYGAWAGRLYVGGVVTPREWKGLPKLTDSKDMSHEERVKVASTFRRMADVKWHHVSAEHPIVPGVNHFLYCVRFAEVSEIDRDGIWNTLLRLHRACVETLRQQVLERWQEEPLIIIDGSMKTGIAGAISLPSADDIIPAVSMAAVLAKTERDATMVEAEKLHPGYDFAGNKGYGGAPKHIAGLDRLGPCAIHRRTFGPIRQRLREQEDGKDTSVETFMSFFEDGNG